MNLLKYSQQQMVKSKGVMQDEGEEMGEDYFTFKLKGVVVHTGSADSGHYYSLIDHKRGDWYEFNDEDVTKFDVQRLAEEAFGAKDGHDDYRIKNAYLLIYSRRRKIESEEGEREFRHSGENLGVIQKIEKRNQDIEKFEMLFSNCYEEMVKHISREMPVAGDRAQL